MPNRMLPYSVMFCGLTATEACFSMFESAIHRRSKKGTPSWRKWSSWEHSKTTTHCFPRVGADAKASRQKCFRHGAAAGSNIFPALFFNRYVYIFALPVQKHMMHIGQLALVQQRQKRVRKATRLHRHCLRSLILCCHFDGGLYQLLIDLQLIAQLT